MVDYQDPALLLRAISSDFASACITNEKRNGNLIWRIKE